MNTFHKIISIEYSKKDLIKEFVHLPFDLYHLNPYWVPPLEGEVEHHLDRKRNPFFAHSDAEFLIAVDRDSKVVGRLVVLENKRYNEFNHEKSAFFTFFECIDDLSAAQGLFNAGEKWAKEKGLTQIYGPKGFTALDGLGLLVEGFNHRPAFGIPYNLPYYGRLLEECGYCPAEEIVSGYLDPHKEFPAKIHEFSQKVQEKKGLQVIRFRTQADLRKMIPRLKELYNGSLDGTTGNVPLTDEEVKTMADQLLWFADPKLIKILFKGDEPVGFLFAYPDISAAVQRQKGRFLPFGWVDMLLELHRSKWININGAGIIEKYRGMGGTAILFSEMHKSVTEGGFDHADIVQVGLANDRMQNELMGLGIEFYKKHRMYRKQIY